MAKSISKNYFYNILLNVTTVITPFITAPYIARVLEPDGVGLFNFAITYSGYFALFALLGIPTYGVREVAKLRDNAKALSELMSQLMSIAVICSLGVSVIYLISVFSVSQIKENYIIFLLAGFSIYFAPLKINWYYQGIEEFGFITLRTLVLRVISISCLFIFVHEKTDIILYTILHVLGGGLADAWNFTKMWQSGVRPKFTIHNLKPHLRSLLLLFASSIAISIYTVLDTLMLGFMKDYSEVGYYTNAMHISKLALTIVASLSVVAIPRVSFYMKGKDYGKINELIGKSYQIVSFLAVPCTVGICCIAPTFVPLFYGELFMGAIKPLMVLSFVIIAIGLSNITGMQVLVGMGFDKLFLYSILAGTFSNCILNIILIPVWGAVGASIASVVAEFLVLLSTSYFVYKNTPIRFTGKTDFVKATIGALAFIPILYFMKSCLQGWIFIGVYIISCSVAYIVIEMLLRNSSVILVRNIVENRIQKFKKRD